MANDIRLARTVAVFERTAAGPVLEGAAKSRRIGESQVEGERRHRRVRMRQPVRAARPSRPPKSATGHLLGAAGGVEAIFTVLALRDQLAPPTLNLARPDPAADGIDIVAGAARRIATGYAISNGFGFGGVNASLVFGRL